MTLSFRSEGEMKTLLEESRGLLLIAFLREEKRKGLDRGTDNRLSLLPESHKSYLVLEQKS